MNDGRCDESVDTGIWFFDVEFTNEYIRIVRPAIDGVGFAMEHFISLEDQTWNREIFLDGETIFSKEWNFLFPDQEYNFPFRYEYMAQDNSANEYIFQETLHLFTNYEDYNFSVFNGEDTVNGTFSILYNDPKMHMLYFGSAEMPCPYNETLTACKCNLTDPETGYTFSYISDMRVGNTFITTPMVVMEMAYDPETNFYSRINYFNDGSVATNEWDFIAEYNDYFGLENGDSTEETDETDETVDPVENDSVTMSDYSLDNNHIYHVRNYIQNNRTNFNYTEIIRATENNTLMQTHRVELDGFFSELRIELKSEDTHTEI